MSEDRKSDVRCLGCGARPEQQHVEGCPALKWDGAVRTEPAPEGGPKLVFSRLAATEVIMRQRMDEEEAVRREVLSRDPWVHRSAGMRCRTCMWYVEKAARLDKVIGRCRRHAPTLSGFPVVYGDDWCGDHKLDEEKA